MWRHHKVNRYNVKYFKKINKWIIESFSNKQVNYVIKYESDHDMRVYLANTVVIYDKR